MVKIIIKYIFLVIVDLLFGIIARAISPITSLFVDKEGNLPAFLYWFQTPDSNMFGVDGDAGFAEENKDNVDTYWGRWWTCLKWQWRNTAQGFSTYVCGLDDNSLIIDEKEWEDSDDLTHEKRIAYYEDGKPAGFEFKGGWKWCSIFYFRWRIGWKFNFAASRGYDLPAQLVFSINPFKQF